MPDQQVKSPSGEPGGLQGHDPTEIWTLLPFHQSAGTQPEALRGEKGRDCRK